LAVIEEPLNQAEPPVLPPLYLNDNVYPYLFGLSFIFGF
jgi:hypothetical protein